MRSLMSALPALFISIALAAQDDRAAETQSLPTIEPVADMVIWGGPIYTASDDNPQVSAVAIKDGRFVFVGSRAEAESLISPSTKVISIEDGAMYPGFIDGHAHLAGVGQRELSLNLDTVTSLSGLKAAVAAWRAAHPDEPVLVGRGWIETHWPEGRFPTRWDLDQIESQIPVILSRADGHALVANSKAMEVAGISGQTASPSGGSIHRNALGEPTGILIDTAQGLVQHLVPTPARADTIRQLVKGGEIYAQYGWTGMHNMSVPWDQVGMLEDLSDGGRIGIRVYNSIVPEAAEQLFAGGISESSNKRIITRAIKLYMDGALGSRGAALLEPYSDADTSGLLLSNYDATMPLLNRALEDGFQINMHAIGDRANRLLLDWFEEAFANVPPLDRTVEEPRWRNEHAQIINMADILRFNALGVIPSMQPSHAIGDLHFAPDRLEDSRLNGAYAWSTLIGSGARVVGGSDAPVERGNPLIEFYAATARRDLNGFQGANWHPEEALTRSEALKMFTIWPAYASFQEDQIGTIEVGKRADLTVFDIDLMTAAEMDIPKGRAILTIVDGEIIFQAVNDAPQSNEIGVGVEEGTAPAIDTVSTEGSR